MRVISNDYENFVNQDFERYSNWHKNALKRPPHQYEVCGDIISRVVADPESEMKVLNVCAGNGSLIYYLKDLFPLFRFVGIDTVRRLMDDEFTGPVRSERVAFFHIEIESLAIEFEMQFDITLHWMRLLHFAEWKSHLRNMMLATKPGGHILVSSLFNDHDVDLLATVLDYNIEACREGCCLQYNTLSCHQVEKFCYSSGAKQVKFYPYYIPFDIRQRKPGVGSYTVTRSDGMRETISGGLRMQWKILHIYL